MGLLQTPVASKKRSRIMMTSTDVWAALGTFEDDQALHVLTQLFARYEQRIEQNPDDLEAHRFFQNLASIMEQVQGCNVNRR